MCNLPRLGPRNLTPKNLVFFTITFSLCLVKTMVEEIDIGVFGDSHKLLRSEILNKLMN